MEVKVGWWRSITVRIEHKKISLYTCRSSNIARGELRTFVETFVIGKDENEQYESLVIKRTVTSCSKTTELSQTIMK